MKKVDSKEAAQQELLLSVAIVKDIIERYFHADVEINEKVCPCNLCTHTISAGKPAIFVKTFDRKATMPFCDKSCADAHEVLEMEFFGCKQLEQLPPLDGKKKKMRRSELIYGYHRRLEATQQDALDRRAAFRKSYQLDLEE